MAAVALSGCGSDSGDDGGKSLTYVSGVAGDNFFITAECAAKAEAKELGYSLDIQAPQKWDAALQDDRLLSDASREAAFTVHTPIDDEADVDGYGYGWRVHDGPDGRLGI